MNLFASFAIFAKIEYGYTRGKKQGKTLFFELELLRVNDVEIVEEDAFCWCCEEC
jgi:hypothetical protein